jgi:adenylate cyclase
VANGLERVERRLAAIFAADIVGSSQMMEADEPGTLSAIRSILSEVIEPATSRHRGRIVKTMGDGALIEFASPIEAVLCGVEVQTAMRERAGHDRTVRRIDLRIGINLGDVAIAQDGDIHGDSVNIAVRLEGIADCWRRVRFRQGV